ncbi:MAG: hypothetical protein SAK29_40800 [Scytonema sp. PMC 1069.18]|nr:hypothetical protein [Scytonema sp. PMC 1069.18]MEC4888171.1 hypothetical protein [Scytonema sp. PMC 1070.18]
MRTTPHTTGKGAMFGDYCNRHWFNGLGIAVCSAMVLEMNCAIAGHYTTTAALRKTCSFTII